MMAGAIDDNQKDIIKEAVRQFVDAQMQGQQPDLDEFVKKYPGLDSKIREGITELQKINALFDSLVQADESDFEDAVTGQDLIGRKVGSFEIVEMIGRGGMGVVYLARDTKLKRSVAIKSIPASLASDSTARMRFHREAKLLASLNHPNIAVIHDIIKQDEGVDYLVLEYVPGETTDCSRTVESGGSPFNRPANRPGRLSGPREGGDTSGPQARQYQDNA
jgi:serine/threonine protein kinase